MTAKDARLWQKQTCKRKALSSPQCYFVSVYIVARAICNSFSFLCSNIQDEIGGKLTFSKTSYSYTYTVGIVSIPTIIVVNSPMYGWEDFQALNVEKCIQIKHHLISNTFFLVAAADLARSSRCCCLRRAWGRCFRWRLLWILRIRFGIPWILRIRIPWILRTPLQVNNLFCLVGLVSWWANVPMGQCPDGLKSRWADVP